MYPASILLVLSATFVQLLSVFDVRISTQNYIRTTLVVSHDMHIKPDSTFI